jgi:hypothetical protein
VKAGSSSGPTTSRSLVTPDRPAPRFSVSIRSARVTSFRTSASSTRRSSSRSGIEEEMSRRVRAGVVTLRPLRRTISSSASTARWPLIPGRWIPPGTDTSTIVVRASISRHITAAVK